MTYERYKLFKRMQEPREPFESFHAELIAQASRSELDALESEIVRDLFNSKMRKLTLQDKLTSKYTHLEPEEFLKRAINFEHSKLTTMAFQKTIAAATAPASTSYLSGGKIKQEPVMAVRKLNLATQLVDYNKQPT